MMKKTYLTPAIEMVKVKIEKGFAASAPADSFGIENFGYADGSEDGSKDANSAW